MHVQGKKAGVFVTYKPLRASLIALLTKIDLELLKILFLA
jgi:hypothetical protein